MSIGQEVARDVLHFVLAVLLIGVMSWFFAVSVVWCLDEEARQVEKGKKDARTTVLPVLNY